MREDIFPQVCVPSLQNRDLRQLLWHRHRSVQMRTRINQLQALAMHEGYRCKEKLFSEPGLGPRRSIIIAEWQTVRS
jgi:transposase